MPKHCSEKVKDFAYAVIPFFLIGAFGITYQLYGLGKCNFFSVVTLVGVGRIAQFAKPVRTASMGDASTNLINVNALMAMKVPPVINPFAARDAMRKM